MAQRCRVAAGTALGAVGGVGAGVASRPGAAVCPPGEHAERSFRCGGACTGPDVAATVAWGCCDPSGGNRFQARAVPGSRVRRGAARGEACAALKAFDPNRPPSGSVASAGTALVDVCGPGDGSGSRRVQNPCGAAPLGRDAARVSRWARPTLYGATRRPNRRPRRGSARASGSLRRGWRSERPTRLQRGFRGAGRRRSSRFKRPGRGTTHQQREGPHHRCCRTGPQGAETPARAPTAMSRLCHLHRAFMSRSGRSLRPAQRRIGSATGPTEMSHLGQIHHLFTSERCQPPRPAQSGGRTATRAAPTAAAAPPAPHQNLSQLHQREVIFMSLLCSSTRTSAT